MADSYYVCSLSEDDIEKARDELHEEPAERLGAVESLVEWIQREPWITSPTDTRFLLSFLRWGKFSQLKARERLENFLSAFIGSHSFMKGYDPCDPKGLEVLRDGSMMVLPGKDKQGRSIIFGKISAIDTSGRYTYEQFTKAFVSLQHSLLFFHEDAQVNGINFLMDFGDVKMNMITWVGLENWTKSADYGTKNFPVRIQGINYYNTGPVFEAFIAIFKPLLPEKIRQRVNVHHNMVTVYEQIDQGCLPRVYLPDKYKGPSAGQISDIVEQNIEYYLKDPVKREFLKEMYSGKYHADLKKKPKDPEAQASYRKLNVS